MTPEIKQRIEKICRGEVPEGYQKTKDGIFPSDWYIRKMKQWVALTERPVTLKDDKRYCLVTVRRGFGGVDLRGEYLGKDILVKNYFKVRKGDFLISKRQIAHGACGVVSESLDGAVVSNEYNVFTPNQGTNIEMFNLMMRLAHYTRLFYLMSDGVHIEKLLFKTQDWMKRKLAMPPIEEQRKIATILNTQDRVIELKEKLLAEKQRQKKYLMQQFLTGKKRLPGFDGEWMDEKLSSFCEFVGGGTPDTLNQSFWKGNIPWISSSDLIIADFKHIAITRFITQQAVESSATKLCPKGCILLVSRVGVGKIAIAPTDLCTSQDFTNIIQYKHNSTFLLYALYFLMQKKAKQTQGSAIKGITVKEIKNISLKFPPISEQTAIAKILSTADHEIGLLQQDIEQEKQKKKALMQLLLTGIVRV